MNTIERSRSMSHNKNPANGSSKENKMSSYWMKSLEISCTKFACHLKDREDEEAL